MVQGHTAKAAADQGDSTLCPRPGSHRRGQGRGGQPALGLKPHGPPHPALLCPSPLRIGTAMRPWKAQPSPFYPVKMEETSSHSHRHRGDCELGSAMEPQPWGHRLSPQETLTRILQIQRIQWETPSDRSHPPREQHQGLRTRGRRTPVPRRHWCVWPCGFCWAAAGKRCLMRGESRAPQLRLACSV